MDMITQVGDTSVVDRRKLTNLKTDELAETMAGLYADKSKTVLLVDDPRQFFSNQNLFKELDTNGAGLHVILQHRGVLLADEQVDVINAFAAVKKFIEDQLAALKPASPPWQFAALPLGWTLESRIRINTKTVRRTGGRGSDYALGITTLQRLWDWVAPYWAGQVSSLSRREHYIRAGGGYYAEAYSDHISIGCQSIQRYELEQLALHFGWTFPDRPVGED